VSDDFRASIERLSNLRGADYGELALTASNILLEKRLPSIDKRLDELRKILMGGMGLNRAWGTAEAGDLKSLIESPTLAVDLLPSLFVDADAAVADAALDVYTKRVYRAHNVISTEIVRADGLDSMNFKFQFNTYPEASPLRCGIMAVTSNLERAKSLMPAILDRFDTLYPSILNPTPYTLYPIPYTQCPIPYTLYPIPYTLYPIPYTLYPIPYTQYPIPYTLYPIPNALYPIPYIRHSSPYTLYPIPNALYPIPYARHSSPYTLYPISDSVSRNSRPLHPETFTLKS